MGLSTPEIRSEAGDLCLARHFSIQLARAAEAGTPCKALKTTRTKWRLRQRRASLLGLPTWPRSGPRARAGGCTRAWGQPAALRTPGPEVGRDRRRVRVGMEPVGCANPIVAEEALVSGWWPSGLGEEAAAPLLASASGDRNGEAGLCSERMELEFDGSA